MAKASQRAHGAKARRVMPAGPRQGSGPRREAKDLALPVLSRIEGPKGHIKLTNTMFAVIETGGKQYKVVKGDTLDIEKLEEKEGATVKFDKVLLVDEKVGAPSVSGASVTAKIVGHKRGEKIVVFKMKAKKRYQKTQGHRQEISTVEITDIKA